VPRTVAVPDLPSLTILASIYSMIPILVSIHEPIWYVDLPEMMMTTMMTPSLFSILLLSLVVVAMLI